MSVKYRLVRQATPGVKGGGNYKYYARACDRQKIDLYALAETLEQRSTLSRADIIATLVSLVDLIPELLLQNRTVELDELGIFSLNLKSEGVDDERTDGYRLIKGVDIAFRPSRRMKEKVKQAKFSKSK